MSSAAPLSSVDALIAAAHELKLRRLAEQVSEKAVAKTGKKAMGSKKTNKPPKPARCSLRLTHDEYRKMTRLKKALARRGVRVRKSELVRAGLLLLVNLNATDLKSAIRDVIAPELAAA